MTTTTMPRPATLKPSIGEWFARHWLLTFAVVYGAWVWMPFLAPVFMHAGWTTAGKAIYFIYAFFCHQLPERSYFLFGPRLMYPLSQIQTAGSNTSNPFLLRQFVGSASMGWKIAWSDRMISFYTSIWIFALLWKYLSKAVWPLPWWGCILLLLPIVLDGGTHAFSDLAGIGHGFRDTNQWLMLFTGNTLPSSFYAGDGIGSFNSWMRLLTGVLAGLGIVWFAFPHVEESFVQG